MCCSATPRSQPEPHTSRALFARQLLRDSNRCPVDDIGRPDECEQTSQTPLVALIAARPLGAFTLFTRLTHAVNLAFRSLANGVGASEFSNDENQHSYLVS